MNDDTPLESTPVHPVAEPADSGPRPEDAAPEPDAPRVPEKRKTGAAFALPPASQAVLTRGMVVFGITLLLMLPLTILTNIVEERAELQDEAVQSITSQWGGPQRITGPVLVVPYKTEVEELADGAASRAPRTEYALVLPRKVDFSGGLASELRWRGIYKHVVYTAPLAISGEFRLPKDGPLTDERRRVLWDQAFVYLGVSNLESIASLSALNWAGEPGESFKAGAAGAAMNLALRSGAGLQAGAPLRPGQHEAAFSLDLTVKGSHDLSFAPVGETTSISLKGDWPAPNFTGRVLPVKRDIGADGFTAGWSIPHIARAYPQSGNIEIYKHLPPSSEIGSLTAGVSLHDSVPLYRQIVRAVKYGALFIGLTFTALFCFEMILRSRLHLVQYGLVGVSMCLFYLVLLALAEQVPFAAAFAAAGGVSVLMNSLYVAAALRSRGKGAILAALLICLYGVLYALLQLEDYAVLCGTALVTVVVGVLMYLTRNLGLMPAVDDTTPETGA